MNKPTAIVLQVGGREIMLTSEEARQVHAELEKLFGHTPPVFPFPQPIYIEPYPNPWKTRPWEVDKIYCMS